MGILIVMIRNKTRMGFRMVEDDIGSFPHNQQGQAGIPVPYQI